MTASPLKNNIYLVDRSVNPTLGYLLSVNDSTLGITPDSLPYGYPSENKPIPYTYINTVSLSLKGSVGRGALYGALASIFTGGIVGAVSYSEPLHNNSSSTSEDSGWTTTVVLTLVRAQSLPL